MSSYTSVEGNIERSKEFFGIVESPSETRPINRIGSKLKGMLATSLNQSASISSLPYSKVHVVLIYMCGVGKAYFSKCKGVQVMRLK